jgi:hypothetical protein
MPKIRAVLVLVSLAFAASCGDDDNLADPTVENDVDTLPPIGSLTDTPINTPSGFSVTAGGVRTDQTTDFDFAFDILGDPDTGQTVFVPRAALGISSPNSADPGIMRRDEPFDEIARAPSNGYITEDIVPVEVGERFLVRSRVVCNLGVPVYAKVEVLRFEDNSVVLKVLANTNCGYRDLQPGFPDR